MIDKKIALLALLLVACCGAVSSLAFSSAPFPRGNLTYAFAVVHIRDGNISPECVTVYKNGTVTWVNDGPSAHALNISGELSYYLAPGDSYSINIHQLGYYPYYCRYHGERGAIVVK